MNPTIRQSVREYEVRAIIRSNEIFRRQAQEKIERALRQMKRALSIMPR